MLRQIAYWSLLSCPNASLTSNSHCWMCINVTWRHGSLYVYRDWRIACNCEETMRLSKGWIGRGKEWRQSVARNRHEFVIVLIQTTNIKVHYHRHVSRRFFLWHHAIRLRELNAEISGMHLTRHKTHIQRIIKKSSAKSFVIFMKFIVFFFFSFIISSYN